MRLWWRPSTLWSHRMRLGHSSPGGRSGFFAARARVTADEAPPLARPTLEVLPGVVPIEALLGHTSTAGVAVGRLRAYPTGFSLTLLVRLAKVPHVRHIAVGHGWRRDDAAFPESFAWAFGRRATGVSDEPPEDFLRFGVAFADGRTVTNLDVGGVGSGGPPDVPRARLVHGYGGGLRRWDCDVWVQPLPPPGPLSFVCAWPAKGIPETWVAIDGTRVLDAAARSVGCPAFVESTP